MIARDAAPVGPAGMSTRRRGRTPAAGVLARRTKALVVAHRGDSVSQAEHTLAAYQGALDTGADGLECDVRLTRDGHLICVHDRKINRTSNGHGVVSELDLAGLSRLDFSSWHRADGPDEWPASADELVRDGPYLDGVTPDRDVHGGVLTLAALLELVAGAGRPTHLLIETKHPTRYAGLVEKELVRVLGRFRQTSGSGPGGGVSITVMSFAMIALRRVRLLAPELPTVLLVERPIPGRRTERTGAADILGPGLALLRHDPDLVARAHARGHPVYVWTVDDDDDVEFVLGLGADAVISNRPGAAIAVRDRMG